MKEEATRVEMRLIWTRGYRPFVMGGSVHYDLGCKTTCEGPFDVGRGYSAWMATAPNGNKFVAEATTGAIVGGSLEQVREDIKTGDPELMKKQMADAKQRVKDVEEKDPAFFWHALKCDKAPFYPAGEDDC